MRSFALVLAGVVLAVPLTLWADGKTKATSSPNQVAAQKAIDVAIDKLAASASAAEPDDGGHAAKAKKLLEEARDELKLAAPSQKR